MKKIFINEAGTLNLKTVIFTIIIVLFLIIVLMYLLTIFNKPITDEDGDRIEATTKKTTTMNLCKDCKLGFINSTYSLKTNESIDISSVMSLKSINVKNIKFSDYDQTIVDIKSTKEGLMLKALNKLGTTKLKATYQDKTAEITLSVFSDYISSAKLFSDNYYVYLDDKTDLSLDTNPENVEAGFFDVFVDDENIATIKDGVISGKTLGKTIMKMDYNGITSTSNLYVIKNRIAIYLMENNSMKEYSEYTTSIKTFNILVKSLDKDIAYNDLSFNIDSNGSVNYIEPDIEEPNTFKYAVNLANEGTYNLEFTLNDGSKTGMKIIYKGN